MHKSHILQKKNILNPQKQNKTQINFVCNTNMLLKTSKRDGTTNTKIHSQKK